MFHCFSPVLRFSRNLPVCFGHFCSVFSLNLYNGHHFLNMNINSRQRKIISVVQTRYQTPTQKIIYGNSNFRLADETEAPKMMYLISRNNTLHSGTANYIYLSRKCQINSNIPREFLSVEICRLLKYGNWLKYGVFWSLLENWWPLISPVEKTSHSIFNPLQPKLIRTTDNRPAYD